MGEPWACNGQPVVILRNTPPRMRLTTYDVGHIMAAVDVITTDEFASWYRDLDAQAQEAVNYYVTLLEARGVALGQRSLL